MHLFFLTHNAILPFNCGIQHLNKRKHLFHLFCCNTRCVFEPWRVYEPGYNAGKYSTYVGHLNQIEKLMDFNLPQFLLEISYNSATYFSRYSQLKVCFKVLKLDAILLDVNFYFLCILSTTVIKIHIPLSHLRSKGSTSVYFS